MDPDTAILAVYAVSLEGRASIALVTCYSLSLPIRASEDDAPFVSVSVSAIMPSPIVRAPCLYHMPPPDKAWKHTCWN